MRKLFTIFVLCCVITPFASAQGKWWSKVFRSPTKSTRALLLSSANISTQLSRRVKRTYAQAAAVEKQVARTSTTQYTQYDSSKELTHRLPASAASVLYPDLENVLTTSKRLTNYFLSCNNREAALKARTLNKAFDKMAFLKFNLQQKQLLSTYNIAYDMLWLTTQIPQDTQFLLLGEWHDHPNIQQKLSDFITLLRRRFPDRPMLLLSEMLFADFDINEENIDIFSLDDYRHFYKIALANGITVGGLENSAFYDIDTDAIIPSRFFLKLKEPIWGTPEGLRLRNRVWLKIIQQQRQAHPDALIIVHGGSAHLRYIHPHSVGKALQILGKTYLIDFVPGITRQTISQGALNLLKRFPWFNADNLPDDEFLPRSDFDIATQGLFPQRILQFEDLAPNVPASDITGFDIQIRIPSSDPEFLH